jgi:peptidoglycan/LPS O-acetylase OafA/YrhL
VHVLGRRRLRIVLLVAGLFLAAQAAVMTFGPMTVNEEIECGSMSRPDRSLAGTDHELCRKALAEQRVWAAGSATLSALALIGVFLVPGRSPSTRS